MFLAGLPRRLALATDQVTGFKQAPCPAPLSGMGASASLPTGSSWQSRRPTRGHARRLAGPPSCRADSSNLPRQ
eukprot:1230634-Pyramimonas_sp.AAC.1